MTAANYRLRPLVFACAALLGSIAAQAAQPSPSELLKRLEQMNARLEKVEQRNNELERQAKARAATPEVEKRLKSIEESQARIDQGLEIDRISQYEPELTARLKAVEKDALAVKKAVRKIDALDGLKVGASLTTVAQRQNGLPTNTTDGNSQLNYRTDISVELPFGPIGDVEQKVFAHVRIGQGQGLNAPIAALA